MQRPTSLTTAALTAIGLTFASTSAAEPRPSGPSAADCAALDGECYGYEFKDDILNAEGNAATGAVIRLRSPIVRRTLIRPRTQFVTEMLKSVELI